MSSGVIVEAQGDLLEITLCRPERRNALGEAEWLLLEKTFREAASSPSWDFISIRAEGEFFCSGVDLSMIEAARQHEGGLISLIERNGATLRTLEKLPQFVIVALNGPAVGIGAHLALCGDLVLAQQSAYLWIPEAKLGIPDVLHYQRIEQAMGRSAAVSMLALGSQVSAAEAVSRGLIGQCFDNTIGLAKGVADCLDRLRAVPKPVRLAMKAYLSRKGQSSDPEGQIEACKYALGPLRPGL